jgi:cation/acetate symporter
MLSGISVTLIYVFQHKGIMFIPGTSFLGNLSPNWFFGIEPNAFGVVGAMVNFTVTLIVTRFTPAPPEEVRLLVERVRVPIS